MTKPVNAGKPWSVEDLVILANTAPTKANLKWLANSLGRTESAVYSQWYLLFCAPSYLKQSDGSILEQHKRILKAKKIAGLCVSITPKFDMDINKDDE